MLCILRWTECAEMSGLYINNGLNVLNDSRKKMYVASPTKEMKT